MDYRSSRLSVSTFHRTAEQEFAADAGLSSCAERESVRHVIGVPAMGRTSWEPRRRSPHRELALISLERARCGEPVGGMPAGAVRRQRRRALEHGAVEQKANENSRPRA